MTEASTGVALVGMAGRFAGAAGLDAFWRNLRDGVDASTVFTDEEMLAAGLPRAALADPGLVRRRPILDGLDLFDPEFFGCSQQEAETIDPQQRLFLECSWEALESAGYDPARLDGAVGVFGGVGTNTYFLANVCANPGHLAQVGVYQALLGSDKDFLASRVSYKLDLRGPSMSVQTGCSSSLVAVHLAVQSLLGGECDLALAGGAAAFLPQRLGYLHRPGSINSPDGRCRAFAADANGTSPGDAVGVVVLARLEDALAANATVLGIIRGTAVNHDGAAKADFAAPGARGQADVVAEALAVAGVPAESIGYVEAHGSGTPVGDAIEVAALAEAFGTGRRGFCRIGSAKPNVGHTDTAAGAVGLIKVLLAFRNGELPPTIHVAAPSPLIDFAGGPFVLNTRRTEWAAGSVPRRAGVSSFGGGGTNAHVVVEEPPPMPPVEDTVGWQLLPLSARTPTALDRVATRLADRLAGEPATELADVAHTLQVGRKAWGFRRAVVCRTRAEAVAALRASAGERTGAQVEVGRAEPSVGVLLGGADRWLLGLARAGSAAWPTFRQRFEPFRQAVLADWGVDPLGDPAPSGCEAEPTWLAAVGIGAQVAAVAVLEDCAARPVILDGPGGGPLAGAILRGSLGVLDAVRQVRTLPIEGGGLESAADRARAVRHLVVLGRIGDFGPAAGGIRVHDPLAADSDPGRALPAVVAELWSAGEDVDCAGLHRGTARRRIPLPTYPFERRRCWVEPTPGAPMPSLTLAVLGDLPPSAEAAAPALPQPATALVPDRSE